MPGFEQWEYSQEDFLTPEMSRIAARKYSELANDARMMKGWTKVRVAEEIRKLPGFEETKNEQVYEWLEGSTDPRTSFSKAMEWALGISLPAQCYLNAGKR
jgi:ribosome-binding protein aMBF1 (putative translation factor)